MESGINKNYYLQDVEKCQNSDMAGCQVSWIASYSNGFANLSFIIYLNETIELILTIEEIQKKQTK